MKQQHQQQHQQTLNSFLSFLPGIPYKLKEKAKEDYQHVIWHITNKCNLLCKYCFTNSSPQQKNPSNKKILEIAKKISLLDAKRISIIGGEPFVINTEILQKAMEIIKKQGRKINIDSNLTLLTLSPLLTQENQENQEKLNKLLNCVDEFNTTIDFYEKKLHDSLRGLWDKTIDTIKLLKAKEKIVNVVVVVNKLNQKYIEKIIDFLISLKVDKIVISKIKPLGRAIGRAALPLLQAPQAQTQNTPNTQDKTQGTLLLSQTDVKKLINKLKMLKHKYKEKIEITGFFHPLITETLPSCYCGIKRITIDWNGNAYPCELMIRKIKGISILYNSVSSIKKYWKDWKKAVILCPPSCIECKIKEKCNKICKFATFMLNKNPLATPIFCDIAKRSIYDLIGYSRYSPIFSEGRKRWKTLTAKLLKNNLCLLGKDIYEFGAGGGVWLAFFEEKLKANIRGVKIRGIENDKRMIFLWEIYKRKKGLHSEIFYDDVREFIRKFRKKKIIPTCLMLDNFLTHFSEAELKKIFKKCHTIVLEFFVAKPKKYEYKFENGTVEMTVPLSKNCIKKFLFNGNLTFSMHQYFYLLKDIERILANSQHKIIKSFKKDKYVFLISKKYNKK